MIIAWDRLSRFFTACGPQVARPANLANNAALYRSGAAGGVTTVDNFHQIYMLQDQLVRQGAAARVALWQRIDNETADVRRQLTLKYNSEF